MSVLLPYLYVEVGDVRQVRDIVDDAETASYLPCCFALGLSSSNASICKFERTRTQATFFILFWKKISGASEHS